VEELDAETLIKVPRAVKALEESWLLLATDFVVGARWMDVRKLQDPHRRFGGAPTAAWEAFRKVAPLPKTPPEPGTPQQNLAALAFIKSTLAATFYSAGPAMPAGDQLSPKAAR
jgi:histidine ammonia-lyase